MMIPSALWAVWYREWDSLLAFAESIAVGMTVGLLAMLAGRGASSARMFQRETLGVVGLGWLAAAQVGALPFFFSGTLGPIDSFFESMSGLTTTGATVITGIESTDKSVLFWRSFTHWIGGIGIVVLFLAVLPYLGAGGKQLFKSEAPGPDPHGLSPRIKDTASVLWKLYLGLTVSQTLLLMAAGMTFYDALCHTFGTIATGGFSTKQNSIAHFDSFAIEMIVLVFMVMAGTNFALYFSMFRGNRAAVFRDREWRIYIGIMALATVCIAVNLMGLRFTSTIDETPIELHNEEEAFPPARAFRSAAFMVVSITTTTGYGLDNFERWPYFSQMVLAGLMFVGGCAGSTGGGVKVIRVIILLKMVYWRLENTFRPKTVRPLRVGEQIIDADMQRRVSTFLLLHLLILGVGSIFMSGMGVPPLTAITSVIATLNNIGPGLEFVGPAHDFSLIPGPGKVVMCFLMAAGRLEIFAILVLFVPAFWKHS